MDHPDFERLQLYVAQRIGDAERLALDAHLTRCSACWGRMSSLRQLTTGLESLNELSLPPEFATDVAEEATPSEHLTVAPARRGLFVQAAICFIILVTCGALLLIVDTPVTDPSDDVLGMIDVLLGSPFQANGYLIAVLAIMSLAGLAVLACVLGGIPRDRPRRQDPVPTHIPRRRR